MAKCFFSRASESQNATKTLGNAAGSCWINYEKYDAPTEQAGGGAWSKCIVCECRMHFATRHAFCVPLRLVAHCALGQQLNCLLSVTGGQPREVGGRGEAQEEVAVTSSGLLVAIALCVFVRVLRFVF